MSHAGLGLREEPLYKGTLGAWDLGQAPRPLQPPAYIILKRIHRFAYGTPSCVPTPHSVP